MFIKYFTSSATDKQSTIKIKAVALIFENEKGMLLTLYLKINANVIVSLLKPKINLL